MPTSRRKVKTPHRSQRCPCQITKCHRLCRLLGCFETAPWVQQDQNALDEKCSVTELQLLSHDSQSNLAHFLRSARATFDGADQGLGGFLNFKGFLDALQCLGVDMTYHQRLALFMNSELDQDGLITRKEFSETYLRILLFSPNSWH